jgi:hypothetical protein
MEFNITLKSQESWEPKMMGIIFVKEEKDIDVLFNLLVKQDEYWEDYKELIQVFPKDNNIPSIEWLQSQCRFVGKTDIYEVSKIKEVVDFFIYQHFNTERFLD